MTLRSSNLAARRKLAAFYEANAESLGVHSDETFVPQVPTRDLRRRGARAGVDGTRMLVLRDRAGVLRWEVEPEPAVPPWPLPAAGRRAGSPTARATPPLPPVVELPFELLPPNQVIQAIQKLDESFAAKLDGKPAYGLRRWEQGRLVPIVRPRATKGQRIALLVHGTFSNCDQLLVKNILSTRQGRDLVAGFDEVLTFDHPTLAVSPVLNAFELANAMRGVEAEVCAVAHSRGGLVVRWWLEAFGGARGAAKSAVLVGSPAAGTSLASPARIRDTFDLLTNLGNALMLAGAAAATFSPFLAAPVVLLKVFASVTSVLGHTPIADASIAIIPGLGGQSRAGNNPELTRLRASQPEGKLRYGVVRSNFESDAPGWQFWKAFRVTSLADRAADKLFPGDNDLVVDSESMSDFFASGAAPKPVTLQRWDKSAEVHHLNYFEQPETIDAIARHFAP